MRATTRLGASFCLSIFSLVSIVLLLPRSRVSTQLQKITLGSTLEGFPTLWDWGAVDDEWEDEGEGEGDGVRLVVFGDCGVDDWNGDMSKEESKGRGRSWAEVLCDVINCTSYINFAESQSADSYPSSAPSGALVSNSIYQSSGTPSSPVLSDLSSQVQAFMALPPPIKKPTSTLFLVSFGLWDIYNLATLPYALATNTTDQIVDELFNQLNVLYWHYSQNLSVAHLSTVEATNTTEINPETETAPAPFRVILPTLLDPSLLPGWLSQRPIPLKPASVAEAQKNAVYLSACWNTRVENALAGWINEGGVPAGDASTTIDDEEINTANDKETDTLSNPEVQKDVFYYDLAQYVLDVMVEHQLEDEGLSDASGLGEGERVFESVYVPCVRDSDEEEEGLVDDDGRVVCKDPEAYMFWDGFELGSVAKETVGKEVGAMVGLGKGMRSSWEQKGDS